MVYIYLHENHKNQPNVGIKVYIPYMDGMGKESFRAKCGWSEDAAKGPGGGLDSPGGLDGYMLAVSLLLLR